MTSAALGPWSGALDDLNCRSVGLSQKSRSGFFATGQRWAQITMAATSRQSFSYTGNTKFTGLLFPSLSHVIHSLRVEWRREGVTPVPPVSLNSKNALVTCATERSVDWRMTSWGASGFNTPTTQMWKVTQRMKVAKSHEVAGRKWLTACSVTLTSLFHPGVFVPTPDKSSLILPTKSACVPVSSETKVLVTPRMCSRCRFSLARIVRSAGIAMSGGPSISFTASTVVLRDIFK